MKINTRNMNPNFTIVLPGPCQANCDFCFWKRDTNENAFLKSLKRVLKKLPNYFTQISISGGEPTISPVFDETLKLIRKYKKKGKFNKVVLTTNGFKLKEKNLKGIDHVNFSRHSVFDLNNYEIFNTKKVSQASHIHEIINHVNSFGIDVNFNVVRTNEKMGTLQEWISFAKIVNVQSITFRNQYGDYTESEYQKELKDKGIQSAKRSQCPVCKTVEYNYFGMKLKFHSSDYEPTESSVFDSNEVYEVILHPNGDLTRDWEGKKIILKKRL